MLNMFPKLTDTQLLHSNFKTNTKNIGGVKKLMFLTPPV